MRMKVVAQDQRGHIISDGGCTDPGDVYKAFAAGVDFVMLGGMSAGHDQCPGEIQTVTTGERFKLFYRMSSRLGPERYNADLPAYSWPSEGRVVKAPYRGDVNYRISEQIGASGLRPNCSYLDYSIEFLATRAPCGCNVGTECRRQAANESSRP